MDGRFIHIINEYIRENYRYEYVDTITDAGPVSKIVYDDYLKSVEDKIVLISINKLTIFSLPVIVTVPVVQLMMKHKKDI